ncbi:type I restriction endonuclease subunit R [Streptomyces scabiei]|uniref:type I restriction endonuclease subunit R n=1 Tax=Streptomyces scabiei TaxID=1930 RepID=UPI001B3415F1|nr:MULTISPECIES: DEAD/DEAH box helicase family protein [Streptomyces]MBP5892001.1 type I restriction endonuclease subunit R [Streptomyces sp. LBUM 1481]MBP5922236.1 type I restriction endonuclease subunit R [Streptomyces sp. LBUM 1483]MDX2685636.1 DEAD/DEAH box helicase family protein [Streptomyces scabiei]MDX2749352.1 DEAD/DEAH box helicase family protein [Streptomyces scabiei]MDX2803489.1 DEAD/DEAH box helicase family protein [Streptomyces scabiei]
MTPGAHTESVFESRVEAELLTRGWSSAQGTFNAELGVDTGELYRFIGATQQKSWNRLIELYGGDQSTAQRQFAQRLASEIDARGVLDVLRQGVRDRGVQMDLAYFRPGHTLAANALAEYNANVLTVARQLHYSARDPLLSLDMAFFVNGLPVATAELKNPNTRQNADHAIAQYRRRDPNEVFFAKRALVHFAVDPDRAFIATRLRGRDTQFLPFNIGSNGPGVSGGAGNPPAAPGSYSVDYLWEQTWQRDNWLEILHRFVHVKAPDKKGAKTNPHTSSRIFPRYHQWDAVQKMVAHAQANGAGHNYLVQHSAGSGKSNTIAWLSHRLSNLFDAGNQPVFHKTIVITDRIVLDRQLQKTIFQFDHTPGVVKKIDEDSTQLAKALDDSTSKIVISTLQMYPFVLKKIAEMGLAGKRYAVIIDEAHSSQGGESAIQLKQALGANAQPREADEDDAEYMTRVRGKQPNLSYFAFTATPKSPTLKLFGTFDSERVNPRTGEQGMHVPFHIYSMRQAIDEGYILDVLANYITYDTKWRLRNAAVEQVESRISNPDVDEAKTKAKLVRFAEQHPKSLEQKAKLIVNDFRENIAGRLGGRAKAMVVTGSRQHALDLYQAIRNYVALCGFTDCGTLVAFSGQLKDEVAGLEFTEAQLNGFPESQLPDRFGYTKADDSQAVARDQDEYQLLVVAEKYQTGFDQPLVCGMYVDKPLTGVAAVQTLSRLNRIHAMKSQDDVHILDFVNEAADIQAAFEDWFETTITEPSDPNLLYTKQREVMEYALLVASEMEAFIRVLAQAGPGRMPEAAERKLHAELHEYLKPAIDRFVALDSEDEREGFRSALQNYVRAYSLIAQIVDWGDKDLERLYQYGRVLLIRLPGRPSTSVDIGDADLSHFRLEFTGRHNVSLTAVGDRDVRGHAADGGGFREPETKPLSEIIEELNDRFGLDLGTSDQILVYQQVVGLVEDTGMQQIALMNDEARFGQVADDRLDDIVAENAERNTDFVKLYFDNNEFRKAIKEAARKRAYRIITEPVRDEALARLRAEMNRETGGQARDQ